MKIDLSIKVHQLRDFRDGGQHNLGVKLTKEEREEIKRSNKAVKTTRKKRMEVYAQRATAGLPLF